MADETSTPIVSLAACWFDFIVQNFNFVGNINERSANSSLSNKTKKQSKKRTNEKTIDEHNDDNDDDVVNNDEDNNNVDVDDVVDDDEEETFKKGTESTRDVISQWKDVKTFFCSLYLTELFLAIIYADCAFGKRIKRSLGSCIAINRNE